MQATTASWDDTADAKNAESASSEVTKGQSIISTTALTTAAGCSQSTTSGAVLTTAAGSGQSTTSGAVLASAAEAEAVPVRPRGRVQGARRSRVTSSDCAIELLQAIPRAGQKSSNTIQ